MPASAPPELLPPAPLEDAEDALLDVALLEAAPLDELLAAVLEDEALFDDAALAPPMPLELDVVELLDDVAVVLIPPAPPVF